LDRWSCGTTKRIRCGDRVFLLRQGEEPRGLVASGWIAKAPFAAPHWADHGPFAREALYVDVEWDWLSAEPVVSRARLNEPPFIGANWNSQSSGISVEAEIALELEKEWGRLVGSQFHPAAEEVTDSDLWEGAVHRVSVNAFERNASARSRCISHYGCKCQICGFDFGAKYGAAAEGLIHVHHLVPISSARRSCKIDPIASLRPVCANCHVVVHRREPPFTIEEVRGMIGS
jgi:5-methylcytosine-specific restriction protein A